MQVEQPGTQDSGNPTPAPDDLNPNPAELNPVEPNPGDPDPDLITPDEEDEEEIEVDGRKFAMPKSAAEKLKAERLMHADYTRKTQEVAETRKAVEAEREQVRQQAQQHQQFIKEVARVHALDDALEQFKQVDWDTLSDQDPVQAQKLHFQYQKLQQQRSEAAQAVTQKQNEHALAEQQTLAKQVQEAEAYVQREIPGWTQERAVKLNSYAEAEGVTFDQTFAKVLVQNPALIKIMHKAEMFDQLARKQSTKPAAPAAPPAPVTRVSAARANARVDPDKMSTEQWMRYRNEQLRKR